MLFAEEKSLLISAKDNVSRLRLSSILSYCQEIADSHAATINISNSKLGNSLAWILTRIFVRPTNARLGGDNLTLSTVPCTPGAVINARECHLHYGGALVADIVQEWTIIDINTRRIVAGGELGGYKEHCSPPSIIAVENKKVRAVDVKLLSHHHDLLVNMNHIDQLGHVNNTYYADFVTACLDHEEYLADIEYFNITYIKEAVFGETLSLYRSRDNKTIRVQGMKADNSTSFAALLQLK